MFVSSFRPRSHTLDCPSQKQVCGCVCGFEEVTWEQTHTAITALDKTALLLAIALCLAQPFTPLLPQPPLVSYSVWSRARFLRRFSVFYLMGVRSETGQAPRALATPQPACRC